MERRHVCRLSFLEGLNCIFYLGECCQRKWAIVSLKLVATAKLSYKTLEEQGFVFVLFHVSPSYEGVHMTLASFLIYSFFLNNCFYLGYAIYPVLVHMVLTCKMKESIPTKRTLKLSLMAKKSNIKI